MEQLYNVTENDSVIGPISRDDAHRKGILHRAGMIFVVRSDGKILLTKGSSSKASFPHRYDCSVAFHVSFGESYEEAAKRELHEELGIDGIPVYLGKFCFHEPPENEMVAVLTCATNESTVLDPTESTPAHFYSKSGVDEIVGSERVTPWLRDGWKLARDKPVLLE